MRKLEGISLRDVQGVYSGPEGDLWELIMGEQIHIGGFQSSMDLATRARIGEGMEGVDFCCCNGAGMRFLLKVRGVAAMTGVDATETVLNRARQRFPAMGLSAQASLVHKDVCESGLPSESFDFAWGEDAWCYVADKARLIAEAVRVVKKGGTVAFTDWVEGKPLTEEESRRYLTFMKFPTLETLEGYKALLERNGCEVLEASDTGRFAPYVDLYIEMLSKQLTYDALKIIGFDFRMMEMLAGEMAFMQRLAHEGKAIQGRFIARKR